MPPRTRKPKLSDPAKRLTNVSAAEARAGDRALQAAVEFAAVPKPEQVRKLLLAYFDWRLAGRKLGAAVREAERSGLKGLPSPKKLALGERARIDEIDIVAAGQLEALAEDDERSAAFAARELLRDLGHDLGRAPGTMLRVGTLRRTLTDGKSKWWVEPHAPEMNRVGLPRTMNYDWAHEGAVVLLEVSPGNDAGDVEVLDPEAVKKKREAPK